MSTQDHRPEDVNSSEHSPGRRSGTAVGDEAHDEEKQRGKERYPQHPARGGQRPSGAKAVLHKVEAMLPDYYSEAFHRPRAWKTFFRCMVAVLATLVLLLCQTSLNAIGSATFFALIMTQMLPPNMAMSIFIMAAIMILFGICLGWAWGAAAMASAIRGRSLVLYQQQLQRFQTEHANDVNPDAQYRASIFEGEFLDPVASTIFGIFLFVGAYFFGFVRAKKPRLTIACIFALIILDLMCTFGPLFPFAQYTLANNLVIPACAYIAIAVACTAFIFPQSLSSIVLDGTVRTSLQPALGMLALQDEVLSTSPADHDKWSELAQKAQGLRGASVAGITGVEGQIGLLSLEITRGRLGPSDVTEVFGKVKALAGRAFGLTSFAIIIDERYKSRQKQRKESPGNHPHPRTQRAMANADKADEATHHMEALIPLMADASADLRAAANRGLGDAMAWLTEINRSRWKKPKGGWSDIAKREQNVADLEAALAAFRQSKQYAMLQPFRSAFDEQGKLKPEAGLGSRLYGDLAYSAQDLFRCYVFTTSLAYFCDTLLEFMRLLLAIERRNPANKLQWPIKFGKKLVESANSSEGGGNPLDTGSKEVGHEDDDATSSANGSVDEEKGAAARARYRPKDPDAGPARNGVQRIIGNSLYKIWKVVSSSAGVFALKQGLASMAIYALAVAPRTAGFFYQNRGLWALIMSQTGMGVYTGEQIGGFIIRFGGTIAGLVVGMVAWYIGAGSGPGNPYGIAASTLVLIAPFMWGRVHAPQPKMVFPLMTGVTMMLVVGYGWVDEHIYQTANQGSGAGLAGRRALLVIIGFAVAFIIMLFPKPDSAKVLVRRTLAKSLSDLGDLYGVMMGALEDESETTGPSGQLVGRGADGKTAVDVDARQARYRDRLLAAASRLMSLQPGMQFASLEPGLKGPWPKEKYHELYQYQYQLISAFALLAGSTARMEPKWVKAMAEKVSIMHPAFIADMLTLFALLHQALAHGGPLPPTIPIFERLAYHHSRHPEITRIAGPHVSADGQGTTGTAPGQGVTEKPAEPASSGVSESSVHSTTTDTTEGSRIFAEEQRLMVGMEKQLSWATVQDEQFAIFATANVALIHTVSALNEIHRIVLSLVGEKQLSGFDRAQERWGQREAEGATY